ncbi:MAG: hypothetical protein ACYC4L_03000 [Chloroflexota bacterium]
MKRVIDLNGVSLPLLGAVGLCLVGAPAALWLVSLALSAVGLPAEAAIGLAWASLGLGLLLLAGFALRVVVEQVQDRLYDAHYRRTRRRRLPVGDGYYECQFCGNRRVAQWERRCTVCGEDLE